MISPTQMRAARAMLNLSQGDVAKSLGIAANTLSNIESGQSDAPASRLKEIQSFYEIQGVEFLEDNGIREQKSKVQRFHGSEGFRSFMDDVYAQASTVGGRIRLWNAKPSNWTKWLGDEWYAAHTKRMQNVLPNISFLVTCKEGETNFIGGKHSEYRWVPEKMFNEQAIYCFGDRIAFLNFEQNSVNIYVLYNKDFADSFRLLFDLVWDEITIIPPVGGYKP